jgi:hypothetical protein
MTQPLVERDERTTTVENAGYRWSFLVLTFGLLAIVAVRSFSHGEQSWDLLMLVIAGGFVNAGYQAIHRVVYRRWIVLAAVTIASAALIAILMVYLRR